MEDAASCGAISTGRPEFEQRRMQHVGRGGILTRLGMREHDEVGQPRFVDDLLGFAARDPGEIGGDGPGGIGAAGRDTTRRKSGVERLADCLRARLVGADVHHA